MTSQDRQWTTSQLADEAERQGKPVTAEYIRRLCKRGRIKADRPGRDWLIPDREAKEWLDKWLSED